MEQAKKKTIRE